MSNGRRHTNRPRYGNLYRKPWAWGDVSIGLAPADTQKGWEEYFPMVNPSLIMPDLPETCYLKAMVAIDQRRT